MTTRTRNSGNVVPIAALAQMPGLVLRLGFTFLRMKAKRRGAVRRFRRALLRGGMRPELAERLVSDYERLGRLRSYLPGGLRVPIIG